MLGLREIVKYNGHKTNAQVVESWIKGTPGSSRSLWTDGTILRSYNADIATLDRKNKVAIFNAKRYSITTSTHQNEAQSQAYSNGYNVIELSPYELHSLSDNQALAAIKYLQNAIGNPQLATQLRTALYQAGLLQDKAA